MNTPLKLNTSVRTIWRSWLIKKKHSWPWLLNKKNMPAPNFALHSSNRINRTLEIYLNAEWTSLALKKINLDLRYFVFNFFTVNNPRHGLLTLYSEIPYKTRFLGLFQHVISCSYSKWGAWKNMHLRRVGRRTHVVACLKWSGLLYATRTYSTCTV